MKYQPYKGYHHKPWLHYNERGFPRRVRTKGDWRFDLPGEQHSFRHELWPWNQGSTSPCRHCGVIHCQACGCNTPWKRWSPSNDAQFQKRLLHRAFRHQVRAAIARELSGEDVSHAFFVSGNWLD